MDITLNLYRGHLFDLPTRRAAVDAFGLCDRHLGDACRQDKVLNITATDAQFGQFIALRVIYGCSNNQIQNLNVKVIPNPCQPRVAPPVFQTQFDVRTNWC